MKLETVNKIVKNMIRVGIIGIAVYIIYLKQYKELGILAVTMVLTFYEIALDKLVKVKLDEKLKISISIFIFSAQCLGSVLDFYGKFPWWDTMLHTLSGVLFFYIGIAVIEQTNQKTNNVQISKPIIILFAICFSLGIGVIWEIFEFIVDTFLGGNMQVTKGMVGQEAVKDTMIDLISVTIGTALISVYEGIKKQR